jgi:hypothetical protein
VVGRRPIIFAILAITIRGAIKKTANTNNLEVTSSNYCNLTNVIYRLDDLQAFQKPSLKTPEVVKLCIPLKYRESRGLLEICTFHVSSILMLSG